MLVLNCVEGPLQGKQISLPASGTLVIGRVRNDEGSIVLDSPRVSRKHAELTMAGSSLYLRDLGSQNGTYLNGKKLEKSNCDYAVEVRHGDKISLGDFMFAVDTGSQAESSTANSSSEIQFLRRVFDVLAESTVARDFYEKMGERILQAVRGERLCMMRFDETQKTLLPVWFGNSTNVAGHKEFEPSMMILHQLLSDRKPIFTVDASQDNRFQGGESIMGSSVRSVICVPMIHGEKFFGAIYVDTVHEGHSFRDEEKKLLELSAEFMSTALQRFRD